MDINEFNAYQYITIVLGLSIACVKYLCILIKGGFFMTLAKFLLPLFFGSTFGANCCNDLSNNVVNIGKHEDHVVKLMKMKNAPDHKIDFEIMEQENQYSSGINSFNKSKDLGMDKVPPLNQGDQGTCVTFSSTAAIDAIIGKGDFISQQCSLSLDLGMGNDYWDGAYEPSDVIDPVVKYGVVSHAGCPYKYPDTSSKLATDKYKKITDVEASLVVSKVHTTFYPKANLADVRNSINRGHRVLMSFYISGSDSEAVRGFDIQVDGIPYTGGLWACSQGDSSNYCVTSAAGHEVVVIGYDDTQKLLKIRNSWGIGFGENGDYYMTYTFFNAMADDLTEIY
jgi:hypothetical protein